MKINILQKIVKHQESANNGLVPLAIIFLACMSSPASALPLKPRLLPNFCDTTNLQAFPELPRSLKCNPPPEPYVLDENGVKNSIYPEIVKNKAALIALR